MRRWQHLLQWRSGQQGSSWGRTSSLMADRLDSGSQRPPAPGAGRSRALVLGTLGFLVTFMVWGLIAPLAVQFKAIFGLSDTQVSLLIAVPVLLGALGRLPVGMLADRLGPRPVYTALLLFLILPLVMMGFARSYITLLAAAFFLGAAGSSFAIGVPFVARWFAPARQGLALGLFGLGNFGQALAMLYAPRMAAALSWPYVYWLMIIPVALTAMAIWRFGRDAPRPAVQPTGAPAAVWADARAWLLSLFYFISFGGFVAFGNYLPKLYQELHAYAPAQAGAATALFVLVATLARPLGGWISDLVGAPRVLLATFGIVSLSAVSLSLSPGAAAFSLLMLGLALALGMGSGAVFKLVPQHFAGRTGAVTGMVGAIGAMGGFFPPLVMGVLRDQVGTYQLGFLALALAAAVGLWGTRYWLSPVSPTYRLP